MTAKRGPLRDRLAITGGMPTFTVPRHVGRPNLPEFDAFTRRMEAVFDSRCLTNHGPAVDEFERRVAERMSVCHCVTTCSATSGLMVLARALGLSGEVVMPSFTFVGTAHAMRWLGLKPVFCDIDPESHTIDPRKAEETLTDRTSAILGVHLWGRACDTEALEAVGRQRGLPVIYDAAPAFDCSRHGVKIGNFGVAEVVSFHATKVLNTFEGGAILTNDDGLADELRLMARFGFEDEDLVVTLGINAKMSEAAAAMGLAQLEQLDRVLRVNRDHHARYRRGLSGLPGLSVYEYPASDDPNYHYLVLELEPAGAPMDRDFLKEVLAAENVLARRYFYPGCHRMAPYADERPNDEALPATDALADRVLQLPTGTAMSAGDVDAVCRIVHLAFEGVDEIAANAPWLRSAPRQ